MRLRKREILRDRQQVANKRSDRCLDGVMALTTRLNFFQQVEYLTRAAAETIDMLRLSVHGADFDFADAAPEYARDDGLVPILHQAVSEYLEQTKAERILGLPKDWREPKDPIRRNTSTQSHSVAVWRNEHYARMSGIDVVIAEAGGEIDTLLELLSAQTTEALRRETGIECDVNLVSNAGLFRVTTRVKSELYRKAGVREDPELLYQTCFQAVVKERSWEELSNAELLKALEREGISVDQFEAYLGRRITVPSTATPERKGVNDLGYRVGEEAEEARLKAAVKTFVGDLRFPRTYNEAMTIERVEDRWAFILRRAYELSQEEGCALPIGFIAQHDEARFQRELESYGLRFLCPYVRLDGDSLTRQFCMIDGQAVMTTCEGRYYGCVIYRDRTSKVALGEFTLPRVIETRPTRVQIPQQLVEVVDLRDLRDWWEGTGEYD